MGHLSTIGQTIQDVTGKFMMLIVGATAASRASHADGVDCVPYDPNGPPPKKGAVKDVQVAEEHIGSNGKAKVKWYE
ncbi:uncharacterized protein PODANS_5_12915 [Podospora anserina S mat+]|uniref:Podospora anserina S mat+ genomic DNA chromosome 5, supercontig 3 n=1 Tax=Podospora anserina (strain S / ATCC MYA-4624 / DSM 980 / FGSC 10383) TaxID=515849 RepID=B2AFF1_PODAN|nr:uncharacterized protein PODANS_5_12915 [Podospora anserina S mat+]CAP62170.1 unnamed protein product [Podospora anserina S mat+]CDP29242.1 Putative protein of unknown function [Podospora anserina S mat+]